MKKGLCKVIPFWMILCLLSGLTVYGAEEKPGRELRGVWVATVLSLDFPSKPGVSPEAMKAEIQAILDRVAAISLNTVFLQVRPAADALYPSLIFPWSEYLTGVQGKAPGEGFDPLAYWIEQAHERGIELHAWINPYRVSHSTAGRKDVSSLAGNNIAKQNPSWVVAYKNGLYFDPGLPETKKLVIDGVKEIIENYDVDGIHLDDYFYPGTDFVDDDTYRKYGDGKDKGNWRRENVNGLVKGIQEAIKETKPDIRFGISPFAIWQNRATSPLGSDTNGLEAYKTYYSDTRRWVKEGWLDYICPQIYWHIGYPRADYQKLLEWWSDVCEGTEVELYIGHGAYKESEGIEGYQGEMLRQLTMNKGRDVIKGSIFYRYGNLQGALGNQIGSFYQKP